MLHDNNADRIRKEVLIRVAQALREDAAPDALDRIPLVMRTKDGPASRCCVYRDRQTLKYRCMAALGFSAQEEEDELKPLNAYAKEAFEREELSDEVLSVIDMACSACIRSRYMATEACRGCIAHPCVLNCPKGAIRQVNGRAQIDAALCVNCGICMKACPYHAIIRLPIPCEEACPVGAITKDAHGRDMIDHEKCIYCGKCAQACPFGAIVERSQMVDVIRRIREGRFVVAMTAPSVAGQFPGTPGQLTAALLEAGFSAVEDVSEGAMQTAEAEAEEWREKQEEGLPFMTTSCCPAYVRAAERHIPELKKHVSATPSPMVLSARRVKERRPDAVTVFIGPCMAKRYEALHRDEVDYALTFDELGALLVAAGVDVAECAEPEAPADEERTALGPGRRFAVSGG